MSESVYRVTEVIGVSAESWEAAARNAVETAAAPSVTCASPRRPDSTSRSRTARCRATAFASTSRSSTTPATDRGPRQVPGETRPFAIPRSCDEVMPFADEDTKA